MDAHRTGDQFHTAAARVSRLIRWLMIVAIGLSYDFTQPNARGMAALLGLAAAFTLAQSVEAAKLPHWWRHPGLAVSFDLLWLSAILVAAGNADNRYLSFYVAPGLLAGYIGSRWLMRLVVVVQAAVVGTILLVNASSNLTTSRQTLAWFVVVLALEWQAGELLAADRRRHHQTQAANDQLEAERQRLLALINSLASAVAVVDNHGRITLYNGALLELLDTNRQLQGLSLSQLMTVSDPSGAIIDLDQVISQSDRITQRRDLTYLAVEGSRINLDLIISPIWQPNPHRGSAAGSIVMLRDITKEKTLDEQRDEFISLASHELRTPLAIAEANLSTAVLPGYAKIAPKALALVNQAHNNIVFLGQLIKDLTDLSLAEAGKIKLALTPVDAGALLEQLVRNYRAEAEAKGLTLALDRLPTLPQVVSSEHQIREVLQNFVTNAIKYTQRGSITIGAGPDESGRQLVLWVKDTGIGIAASDQKHLFSKFYRSEDYRTRETSGTGLGLYITKKLAELLHGRVWFTSRLNRGSTFYLQVPTFPDAVVATKS